MRALVVAAGEPPGRADLDRAWPGWAADLGVVIAADGGAITAERLGLRPDLVVGDLDSIEPAEVDRLRASGIPVEVAPTAKDESDTELAVRAALARGATTLTIVGALGGRVDHLLANLALLALPELDGIETLILDGRTRISLVRGPGSRPLIGRVGDLVTLLPFGAGVEGVRTEGLAWALRDEALPAGPARGLSNVRTAERARVQVRSGDLVVVETIGEV
jgi:thiamine pyrophosphokinase